jgi:putative hydrolase of the HAD superfamily
MSTIRAITFDLWDTVFIDDSDEPKRRAAGKPPKQVERRNLVWRFLEKHDPALRENVDAVYDAVDAVFREVWHEKHVTWTVRERLSFLLRGLGRTLPESELEELVRLHETMELQFRPDLVPGVRDALHSLQGPYQLGVISDAIFTPGRALRTLLADEGLLDFFDVTVFSDEVGRSKPAPEMFHAACAAFSVEPRAMVHIGDREPNDIAGAQGAGARAVLCTAVVDRGSAATRAEASFHDYRDLPALIKRLDG